MSMTGLTGNTAIPATATLGSLPAGVTVPFRAHPAAASKQHIAIPIFNNCANAFTLFLL
jgi:hypothetical protein